jgi:hypothetical protein
MDNVQNCERYINIPSSQGGGGGNNTSCRCNCCGLRQERCCFCVNRTDNVGRRHVESSELNFVYKLKKIRRTFINPGH